MGLAGKNARRAPLYLQTRFKGTTQTLDGVDATLYLAEKPDCQGRTVVLCPGGGYNHLAGAKEGADWVPFFHGLGISVAVVRYRLPEGDRNRTLGDVRKVFEQIHRHADEWGINPNGIGIMGFSAGGHLAAAYSNAQCDSLRPAFSILLYPVIKLDTKPHQGMAKKFLGDSLTQQSAAQWSADRMVSQETPPAFIAAADDDPTIDVLNGVAYYEALHRAHVPAVLHIYRDGGHGWGYKTSFPYHDQLLNEPRALAMVGQRACATCCPCGLCGQQHHQWRTVEIPQHREPGPPSCSEPWNLKRLHDERKPLDTCTALDYVLEWAQNEIADRSNK